MSSINLKKVLSNWISELRQPIRLKESPEISTSQQKGERDETFDVLKGIAIIFVIVGHSEIGCLYPFIYSFHMPLFFLVTGYFLKIRPFHKELHLSLRRLIVPYIFTAFCICIAAFCKDLSNYTWADGSYTQGIVIKLMLGFRGSMAPTWLSGHIGLLWFILAMFWARIIAVFLIKRIKSISILSIIFLFLGFAGVFLGENVFVPYCIPQGLSATSFIYIGFLIKKFNLLHGKHIKKILPLFLILWFYTWMNGGMSMARSWYSTGYIFGLFGAVGAFFTLYILVSNFFSRASFFWKAIHFGGRYSLVIYAIHSIDYEIFNWTAMAHFFHIPYGNISLFQISSRLIIVYAFTFLILKIRPLREGIFQINKV